MCGALWTFSVLSFAGPFAWPFAIALTWLLVRHAPDRRDAIGLVAGLGTFLIFIGLIHVGDTLCPESGTLTIPAGETGTISCGGLDSRPWLAIGALILIGALLLYRMARRRASET